ncbi:hypothetical protein DM02DRAFT_724511 [Periconia macrospinosa]|uniref:Rhodopsin domain-containing protein n=1 Tax=Periconia macrospinosa TaxID=97972 RepID=A0A2V1E7G6_9PLEO|nr:hypothetical protein DM02DRAFT_724511 [Periconia macrospinosa]
MVPFVSEMWTCFSRRLFFHSFKAFQLDDWLMMFVIAVYTSLLIVIHIQTYTPTNLLNPADGIVLSPEDISVESGFIVMEILWFIWCRPFRDYWKVPAPNLNCSAETNHMITNAVFNISSDIMIICLPMPILISSQLPLRRKLTLCGVFALGSFTILAAILSKYYSLGSPYGTDWIYWYIREVSTAIITANLPLTWTLLQRIFGANSFLSRNKSSGAQTGVTGDAARRSRFRSTYGNLASATKTKETKPKDPHPIDISPSESQEQITTPEPGIRMEIWQHHEVYVTSEGPNEGRDGATSAVGSDKDKKIAA